MKLSLIHILYRRFLIGETIVTDKKFQDQLKLNLKCNNSIELEIDDPSYRLSDLTEILMLFNSCTNAENILFKDKRNKSLLNISLKTGINISSFDVNGFQTGNKKFETDYFVKFGIEFEFILPYNNNKWAIVIEPTFQQFKTPTNPSPNSGFSLNYSSIEMPVGLRYRMFLNTKNMISLNSFFVYDLPIKNEFKFGVSKIDNRIVPNFVFGLGYKYNNRISLETRLSSKRFFYSKSSQKNVADYKYLSFIIGYNIFKK